MDTTNSENVETEIGNILSVSYENDLLSGCFLQIGNMELFISFETIDPAPKFSFLHNLFRQVRPDYVIASGGHNFLKETMRLCGIPDTLNPREFLIYGRRTPVLSKFLMFPNDEKRLIHNRHRILELNLPGIRSKLTEVERRCYIESIIPLDKNSIVNCLGNLIEYLSITQRQFFTHDDGVMKLNITDIKFFALESQLLIDNNTLYALQIFPRGLDLYGTSLFVNNIDSWCNSENNFKNNIISRKDQDGKEISVFGLLNRCRSVIGTQALKCALLQPTRNLKEIHLRFNTIEWFLKEKQSYRLGVIKENLKYLHNISYLFKTIAKSPNKNPNLWKLLKETIQSIYLLGYQCCEIMKEIREQNLLSQIGSIFRANEEALQNVFHSIEIVIDLESSFIQKRIVIKEGLDADLDEAKVNMIQLQDNLEELISLSVPLIPKDILCDINGYYIPELGYLIRTVLLHTEINVSSNDGNHKNKESILLDVFREHNLRLIFKDECNTYYFKNSLCDQLNERYGDNYVKIYEHEARICQRLFNFLERNFLLLNELLNLLAKLDFLLAFSEVTSEKSYVRPEIFMASSESDRLIEIHEGRHILFELKGNFIPNSVEISGKNGNLINLLTAPNSSGKSVYMKQIALTVFLAHVGCYIPAKMAKISLFDGIFSHIYNIESTYNMESSFLMDLQQMAQIITNSNSKTLIVIDEFGMGTNPVEGLALLTSSIEELLLRGEKCPLTLISTHFMEIYTLLTFKETVQLLTFDCELKSNGIFVPKYKLLKGLQQITKYSIRNVNGVKQLIDFLSAKEELNEDQQSKLLRKQLKFAFELILNYSKGLQIDIHELNREFENLEI